MKTPTEEELKEMGAYGYSIWLMLDPETHQKIKNIISKICNKYGTPYFEPHITLIGSIEGDEEEIKRKTADLVTGTGPFKVALSGVELADNYFKTIYTPIVDNEEISEANLRAKGKFDKLGMPKYMPHLSFAYGNFTPEERAEIGALIEQELSDRTAIVEGFSLYKTDGFVENWVNIGEFKLNERKRSKLKA